MPVAGLILAGGRSTRMGGEDKAFARLGGEPLIAHACRRMARAVGEGFAINANGDPARFAHLGFPVVADAFPDWPGPLAGIHAGLRWAAARGASRLFTTPVDTLFYPENAPAQLAEGPDAGTIAVSASSGRRHPVVALWPVALLPALELHLASNGSRRVNDFIDAHRHVEVDFPLGVGEADPFFNVNTPQDLAQAERLLVEAGR